MKTFKAELIFKINSTLAEGPLWHDHQQKLYWVDIEKMELHTLDPFSAIHSQLSTNNRVGAAVPAKNGNLILALQSEIAELNLITNEIKNLIGLESGIPENRCNDGKCDKQGRFWIGTMNVNCKPGEGSLYCIDGNLKVTTVLQNLTISNGMGWSQAGDKMYFIDSHDQHVKQFDFNTDYPSLTNEKVIIRSNTKNESPDGMCVDSEGMLWVAFWGSGRVGRYDPVTGKQVAEIAVPALHVTSCCFGDTDLQTLYITTARQGLSELQLQEYPLSGSIFFCQPGVSGLSADVFVC
jgi:sugar lactone lactonase YvrE